MIGQPAGIANAKPQCTAQNKILRVIWHIMAGVKASDKCVHTTDIQCEGTTPFELLTGYPCPALPNPR